MAVRVHRAHDHGHAAGDDGRGDEAGCGGQTPATRNCDAAAARSGAPMWALG